MNASQSRIQANIDDALRSGIAAGLLAVLGWAVFNTVDRLHLHAEALECRSDLVRGGGERDFRPRLPSGLSAYRPRTA